MGGFHQIEEFSVNFYVSFFSAVCILSIHLAAVSSFFSKLILIGSFLAGVVLLHGWFASTLPG